jgi:RecG-like helicase
LKVGTSARFSGSVAERNGKIYLTNPEFDEVGKKIPIEKTGALFEDGSAEKEQMIFPVYKETKGISSR